ncbi:MAG: pilus assembly protein PilO [Gammaproteobacteria bacterium SG8_15]|nr:MAG: pilus assembly protein PilO [Gammaproteobacteria bacterium SG8_15]
MNIDLNDLDFSNAGNWPLPIKLVAIIVVCAAVGFAGYWFDTKDQIQVLDNAKAKETELKKEFETKQAVAANLEAYKQQMTEMERSFGALLLQLPSKTEVAELLVDVSREGLKAGLEFELFKPGAEIVREFYAEYPISIRVVGTYHQFGNFASGIAALPRIVTLHNLKIGQQSKNKKAGGETLLVMEATANTYRYLDQEELDAKKGKSKAAARKGKK